MLTQYQRQRRAEHITPADIAAHWPPRRGGLPAEGAAPRIPREQVVDTNGLVFLLVCAASAAVAIFGIVQLVRAVW